LLASFDREQPLEVGILLVRTDRTHRAEVIRTEEKQAAA